MMKNILIVHGPNLNLLGEREPELYGTMTLDDMNSAICSFAEGMHLRTRCFQSNSEGALIDFVHEQRAWAHGIVINPGALTHYSYALRDAISGVNIPTVEVHLSDIEKREAFRKHSVIKEVAIGQFKGRGITGYFRAIEELVAYGTLREFRAGAEELDWDALLTRAVTLLKNRFPKYTWVGIYLIEGDELILHNFLGRPSPHTRIPIGKGICGAAAAEKKSIVVPDVQADPRYLACSMETRSEVVVPILTGTETIGEIDVDSDSPDIFHDGDTRFLEAFAELLAHIPRS